MSGGINEIKYRSHASITLCVALISPYKILEDASLTSPLAIPLLVDPYLFPHHILTTLSPQPHLTQYYAGLDESGWVQARPALAEREVALRLANGVQPSQQLYLASLALGPSAVQQMVQVQGEVKGGRGR